MTWAARWRALRHHRLQGALAVVAIATAMALPVVLLSVGGGVASHEIASLESSGFQITVSAPGLHGISEAHDLSARFAAIPDVAAASPVLSVPLVAFPPGGAVSPLLAEGIVPKDFAATESSELRGLFPQPLPFADPSDRLHFANGTYTGPIEGQVLVSTPLASDFGLTVGGLLRLGATDNASGALGFTIVGFFGTPPASLIPTAVFGVLLPLADLQSLTGMARSSSGGEIDAADSVEVTLVPAASTDSSAISRVASAIEAIAPYYGVSALTQEAAQIRSTTAVLTGFYLALSSVGVTIGLVFLTLVLLRQVDAERRTIGIERALGVPASQIAAEWIARSMLLGAAGAVGGLVGGFAVVVFLGRFGAGAAATAAQLAVFSPTSLGPLVLGVTGLAALVGGAATRSALRLGIPEALR